MNNSESSPLLNGHTTPALGEPDASPRTSRVDIALILKIAAAMYSFMTLGLFNSSIGAVLPLISQHYSLTDLSVSLIFLAGPIGYIIAAQSSNLIHHHFGQRGIAGLGPVLQIVATISIAVHPSFALILVAFAIQGLGTGLLDGSWCAWAGSMEKANTISGLLHGSYSVGGAAGPFFVAIITTNRKPWWTWYYILVSCYIHVHLLAHAADSSTNRPRYLWLNSSSSSQRSGTKTHLLTVKVNNRTL
jgi:fucose permease